MERPNAKEISSRRSTALAIQPCPTIQMKQIYTYHHAPTGKPRRPATWTPGFHRRVYSNRNSSSNGSITSIETAITEVDTEDEEDDEEDNSKRKLPERNIGEQDAAGAGKEEGIVTSIAGPKEEIQKTSWPIIEKNSLEKALPPLPHQSISSYNDDDDNNYYPQTNRGESGDMNETVKQFYNSAGQPRPNTSRWSLSSGRDEISISLGRGRSTTMRIWRKLLRVFSGMRCG